MTLNSRLIEAIIEHIQPNANVANQLSEILSIGKEAVYRRLRNEVPFSFREAGKIALALNISLDQLISIESENKSVFELQFLNSTDMLNDYKRFLDYYINLLSNAESYPNSKLMLVYNTLPPSCFLNYDQLFKFSLYKNLYQLKSGATFIPYSELHPLSILTQKQYRLANLLRKINETYYIIDWTVFPSFIRDVQYFFKLGLITMDEMIEIQKDLFKSIDDFEQFAVSGCFPNGKKVVIYLSNIDFISSHLFIEYGPHYFGQQALFALNSIISQSPEMCLKKNHGLISLSNIPH